MKRLLLTVFSLLVISLTPLFAQQFKMNCSMTYEEVLKTNQPFDIDDPIAEPAMGIAQALIADFTILYDLLNAGQTNGIAERITAIEESLQQADNIGMNYEMFEEDINFIETIE